MSDVNTPAADAAKSIQALIADEAQYLCVVVAKATLATLLTERSALIAERDALRVVAIEQSALLGELSKGLFPDDDLFAQIVEVGAKMDALSSPAVEGA